MTILFFILGVLVGLLLVAGGAALFLKSQDLRLLFVSSDGPGLTVTHKDMDARFITSRPGSPYMPIGEFTRPHDLSEVEWGFILSKKNPLLLKNVVKSVWPQYFSVYEVNQSMSNLINVLGVARDSRRPKQIDLAINLIWAYANDINSYYKWVERERSGKLFKSNFTSNFSSYHVVEALSKITTREEAEKINSSIFRPWEHA